MVSMVSMVSNGVKWCQIVSKGVKGCRENVEDPNKKISDDVETVIYFFISRR